MKIIFNNVAEELDFENLTVTDLLKLKKYTFRMRIVKVNGHLIAKDKYDQTLIQDGDTVQLIYLMSGG